MRQVEPTDEQRVRRFAIEAARLVADRHCEDVRLLDVRNLSQVCDYVLIATGTSDRQMKSLAHELEELGQEHDSAMYRWSADEGATWIVIDFVDLVVHLFEPTRRAYYDLEGLWSDAAEVAWPREPQEAGRPKP
jgi:ribosome-associated protein